MSEVLKRWSWWPVGLALALVVGAALRLVYVNDMEYKYDEAWTFLQTQDGSIRETSLWLGIHNSTGFRCPGMSLWIFIGAADMFGITDPTGLARVVQVCNVLALVLLAAFALWAVPREEREPWLWATALAAVNPLTVIFHRKIWPPSVLPLFTVIMLIGWWYRTRRGGAFTWGLVGAILGQIHPSGFFFAAAFFGWALFFDRPRVAWRGWFVGSTLGTLPMVPWFWYLLTNRQDQMTSHRSWHHLVEGKFWIRWITEPFGLGLDYSLFKDYPRFLGYPWLGGHPTYLVGLLHVLLVGALAFVVGRGVHLLWQARGQSWSAWFARCVGLNSPSAFTQNAALLGFGGLLTLSTLPLHRHYMVILFPLEFLWLARLALAPRSSEPSTTYRPGRALLTGLFAAQLLITISFLGYIHQTGGSTSGDYGLVYRLQHRFRNMTAQEVIAIREAAEKLTK